MKEFVRYDDTDAEHANANTPENRKEDVLARSHRQLDVTVVNEEEGSGGRRLCWYACGGTQQQQQQRRRQRCYVSPFSTLKAVAAITRPTNSAKPQTLHDWYGGGVAIARKVIATNDNDNGGCGNSCSRVIATLVTTCWTYTLGQRRQEAMRREGSFQERRWRRKRKVKCVPFKTPPQAFAARLLLIARSQREAEKYWRRTAATLKRQMRAESWATPAS